MDGRPVGFLALALKRVVMMYLSHNMVNILVALVGPGEINILSI